jgi:hypothetical protein
MSSYFAATSSLTVSVEHDGTMLCLCHNFERCNLWTTPETKGKDKFFLDSIITMFQCVGGLAICYTLIRHPLLEETLGPIPMLASSVDSR